jgi:hypothetical protein
MKMTSKEERARLLQQYKEIKIEAGVFQIRNQVNGKLYVDSTLNLRTLNGRTGTLNMGKESNKSLQMEWNEFGPAAFVMEVLEILDPGDNPFVNQKDELKKLEKKWIEKLQPYGDKGYHTLK